MLPYNEITSLGVHSFTVGYVYPSIHICSIHLSSNLYSTDLQLSISIYPYLFHLIISNSCTCIYVQHNYYNNKYISLIDLPLLQKSMMIL